VPFLDFGVVRDKALHRLYVFVESSLLATYEEHLYAERVRGILVVTVEAIATGLVRQHLAVCKSSPEIGVAGQKRRHMPFEKALLPRSGQLLQRLEFALGAIDVSQLKQNVVQPSKELSCGGAARAGRRAGAS
jgi:hypothetical protein